MSTEQQIKIIIIDERGCVTADEPTTDKITLPIVGDVIAGTGVLADRITMRQDWPALNDPRFGDLLRAWHAAHNGNVIPA
jgi:hypothetical protein